ncbi:MAG: hypothetical protein ACE5FZ_06575 [Nitrospiria bacterium]
MSLFEHGAASKPRSYPAGNNDKRPKKLLTGGGDDKTHITDDRDTVFGGHLVLGANIDIDEGLFPGVEGKYIFTDDAEFDEPVLIGQFDLNGVSVTGNLGFRFWFSHSPSRFGLTELTWIRMLSSSQW